VEILVYEIHQGTSQKAEKQKYEWLYKNQSETYRRENQRRILYN
jgi:hypothetical protein